ncbi:ATP-binding protein [Dasania marina]|uniref:ATP-binding protein n=1 Tax=Dasania marina TaxID=471499 RepID=UPI0030DA4EAE|tara:strand:- start:52626 stop:54056 length:1431 start_codon:yes stop_codon:yes gene_type:complete
MKNSYSIENQLTFKTTTAAIIVFIIASIIIDKTIISWLEKEYDRNISNKARVTATLIKDHEYGLEFDFADEIMPEFERSNNPEYFQIFVEGSGIFERSRSLQGTKDLPTRESWDTGTYFTNITLLDGRKGRQVEIIFYPQIAENKRRIDEIISNQKKVKLVIAKERETLDKLILIIHSSLLLGSLISVIILAFQMKIITRRSLRPLHRLKEEINQLNPKRPEQRVSIDNYPQELSTVVTQFNETLSRIEESIHREKRFTSDVAHELRTPISELQAMTEVAIRWNDDKSNHDEIIRDVYDISIKMQNTTNNLLSLARCDKGAIALDNSDIDIHKTLKRIIGKHSTETKIKNIIFDYHSDNTDIIAISSKTELEIILGNIINNAVEYAIKGSVITIHTNNQKNTITVKNHTSSLEKKDLPLIFERFWRKDQARSSSMHSGLGMSLIKSYSEQLNLHIEIDLDINNIFSITLSGFVTAK